MGSQVGSEWVKVRKLAGGVQRIVQEGGARTHEAQLSPIGWRCMLHVAVEHEGRGRMCVCAGVGVLVHCHVACCVVACFRCMSTCQQTQLMHADSVGR